jgi:hypothetical protein
VTVQGWCRDHKVPYLHGCVWDRECRADLAPMRIALMWGRHMWWIDFPGYYLDWDFERGYSVPRRSWHRLQVGHHLSMR